MKEEVGQESSIIQALEKECNLDKTQSSGMEKELGKTENKWFGYATSLSEVEDTFLKKGVHIDNLSSQNEQLIVHYATLVKDKEIENNESVRLHESHSRARHKLRSRHK